MTAILSTLVNVCELSTLLSMLQDETLQERMDAIRSKYTTILRASKSSVEKKKELSDDLSF